MASPDMTHVHCNDRGAGSRAHISGKALIMPGWGAAEGEQPQPRPVGHLKAATAEGMGQSPCLRPFTVHNTLVSALRVEVCPGYVRRAGILGLQPP